MADNNFSEMLMEAQQIEISIDRINASLVEQKALKIDMQSVDMDVYEIGNAILEQEEDKKLALLRQEEIALDQAIATKLVSEERGKADKDALKIKRQGYVAEKRSLDAKNQLNRLTKDYITMLTGIRDDESTFFRLINTAGVGGLNAMANAAKRMISPLNVAQSIVSKIVESTIATVKAWDEAFSSYNRATGFLKEDSAMLERAAISSREYGIGLEEVAQAATSLRTEYAGFSEISDKMRGELVKSAAKFERIGVSASQYANNMNLLNKQLGFGVMESQNIQKEIVQTGMAMGITASQTMKDFSKAMGVLDMYGKRGVKVFQGLQAEAKRLGVDISELTKMETKFTTFENAAKLAGELGAIAGKSVVDPIKLMMAEGEEKQKLLHAALKKTGLSFDNPRDILYASKALGVSVSAVRAILNPKNITPPTKDMENFNDVVKSSAKLWDQLQKFMRSFAVAVKPIITILKSVVEKLNEVMNMWGGNMGKIILLGSLAALAALKISRMVFAFKRMKQAGGIISTLTSKFNEMRTGADKAQKALVANNAALGKVSNSMKDVGQNADVAAKGTTQVSESGKSGAASGAGFLKMAVGVLALAGAMLLFAGAVYILFSAFKLAGDDLWEYVGALAVVTGIMFGVVLGMVALSSIATAAAPLLISGFTMIILASGMLVVASTAMMLAGMMFGVAGNYLTPMLSQMSQIALTMTPLLVPFSAGLIVLGGAMIAFATSMMIAGIMMSLPFVSSGIGELTEAMDDLAGSISSMPEAKLSAFSSLINSFSDYNAIAEGLNVIANGFERIADSMWSIALVDFVTGITGNLSSMFDSLSNISRDNGLTMLVDNASNITENQVKRVQKIVEYSEIYNKTKGDANTKTDRLVELIESVNVGINAGNSQQAQSGNQDIERDIVLNIDKREFARATVKAMKESNDLRMN